MSASTYFYSGQIRKFLTQFIRMMSNFSVEFGADRDGNKALQRVPVFYGDPSRQAAQILQGNTENALPTVPCMACYITALDYDRTRVQNPTHVSKLQIRERAYDSATDTWGHGQGNAFTVERMMPAPYKITMKLDVWVSNTEQQLQLQEQMLPLFNPAFEIQSTDNYIDWTSLSAVFLESVTWNSRTVPQGASATPINIWTATFSLPIWLSLPAKIKKMGVIEKIIMSIYDDDTGEFAGDILNKNLTDLLARRIITPMNYGIVYSGNTLRLYRPEDRVTDTVNGTTAEVHDTYSWKVLADIYGGTIVNGITQVRLDQPNGSVVVGTVSYHPVDQTALLFSPIADTLPTNTLMPINAIVDPYSISVDNNILNAVVGTRYLIIRDVGSLDNIDPAIAWQGTDGSNLVAKANDIIEYDGTKWFVAFSAEGQADVKYCTNITSGLQFKWSPDEQEWNKSTEGQYEPGAWTLVLTVPTPTTPVP